MSLLSKRPHVDHAATAARLRAQPGVWLPVGEYGSSASADSIARAIRSGYERRPGRADSPYAPCGTFEARLELTEFGARITARYVGEDGRP